MSADAINQAVTVRTLAVPTVTRWDPDSAPWVRPELADGPTYVLEFEDAGVSVRLSETQVRGLGANILWATMTSDEDLETTGADDPE